MSPVLEIVMILGWGVGRVVSTLKRHAVTRFLGSSTKPFVSENVGKPPEMRVSFKVIN